MEDLKRQLHQYIIFDGLTHGVLRCQTAIELEQWRLTLCEILEYIFGMYHDNTGLNEARGFMRNMKPYSYTTSLECVKALHMDIRFMHVAAILAGITSSDEICRGLLKQFIERNLV